MDNSRPTEKRCLGNDLTESPASETYAISSTSSTNTYSDGDQSTLSNLSSPNAGSEESILYRVDDHHLSPNRLKDLQINAIRSFRTPQIERRAFCIDQDWVERHCRNQRAMSDPCVLNGHGMPMMCDPRVTNEDCIYTMPDENVTKRYGIPTISDPCVTIGDGIHAISDSSINNSHGINTMPGQYVDNGHGIHKMSDLCLNNGHGIQEISDSFFLKMPESVNEMATNKVTQLTKRINSDFDKFSKVYDFDTKGSINLNRDDSFLLKKSPVNESPIIEKKQNSDAHFPNIDDEVVLSPSTQNISGYIYSPSWQDLANSDRLFTSVFFRDASLPSKCVTYDDFLTKTSGFGEWQGKDDKLPTRNVAPSIVAKMKRMQLTTDILSLFFFGPGLLFLTLTPFMLIPIFVFPTGHTSLFIALMFASGGLSVLLMIVASIIGNIYWYYDQDLNKMRCKLHCGKGPKFHFWGKSFGSYKPLKTVYVI